MNTTTVQTHSINVRFDGHMFIIFPATFRIHIDYDILETFYQRLILSLFLVLIINCKVGEKLIWQGKFYPPPYSRHFPGLVITLKMIKYNHAL